MASCSSGHSNEGITFPFSHHVIVIVIGGEIGPAGQCVWLPSDVR